MKARLASVLASMTMTTAALAAHSPAHADPVPDTERLYVAEMAAGQNPSANIVHGAVFRLQRCSTDSNPYDGTCDGTSVPRAGTQVHTVVSSCGSVVKETSTVLDGEQPGVILWFSPDGEPDVGANSVNERIGKSFEYVSTITVPGYDTYTLTGSYSGYSVRRPSCDVILADSGGSSSSSHIAVTRWSAKQGTSTTAKVGNRLAVTPTRAAGAKVTYAWKVGTRTVDRDRAMTVKKSHQGQRIVMRVTVSKPGARSVSKTLRYGRAR